MPATPAPAAPAAWVLHRPRAATLALAGLLTLAAGCGGGLYVDVGGGYDLDDPPEVDLVASTDVALPNELVRLVAAASDDFAVDRVSFYRIDGNRSVLLETDFSPPWQLDTVIPASAFGTVRYFARAVDDVGQGRDSRIVTIVIE